MGVLRIDEDKISGKYKQIGYGDEGVVYKYDNNFAFKIFDSRCNFEQMKLKLEKINILMTKSDKSFGFPLGLIECNDSDIKGYYMKYINSSDNCCNLDNLYHLKPRDAINCLVKASNALERIHKQNIIIGDIKGDNILVDENTNPIYIDTDNYMVDKYGYDLYPQRAKYLNSVYNYKKFSDTDSDKYIFGMMALQHFTNGILIYYSQSDAFFKKLISLLNVNQEVKEGLRLIFSDADNKPYIGPILRKIDSKQKVLSQEDVFELNSRFF